jgi:hypothetical protein
MKRTGLAVVIMTAVLTSVAAMPAYADADDEAWIKRCVSDNKDEGQTAPVVTAYCTCMNDKMSSSERLSVTAWEKKNPAEQEACSKQAGWKSK